VKPADRLVGGGIDAKKKKTRVGLEERAAKLPSVSFMKTEGREPSDKWEPSNGSPASAGSDSGSKDDNDVVNVADDVINVADDVMNVADDVISGKDR
jgi:hypothetical protein